MRRPWLRFTARWFMIVMAVLTVLAGLAGINGMVQKTRHYAAQAAIQARLETLCRQEEARLKGETHGFGYVADLKPEGSDFHAELRRWYERLATHPWETPPADLPMPFPWDRDRQVIEAALDDLMDPRNPENAIAYPANSASGSEVVLGEMTYPGDFEDRKPRGEGPGRRVEDEASSELARRNGGGGLPLKELGPGWRRPIRYADLERLYERGIDVGEPFWDYFHQCLPNAFGWLEVSLPGYSRDGRTAIVSFARPSYHGEFWTYVLHKTVTGWMVSRREHEVSQ